MNEKEHVSPYIAGLFWARVSVVSSTPARYEEIIIREKYKFCFFFIFKCITVLSVLRKKWESQVRGLECLQDPKSTENSRAGYWTEIKVSSHCSITSFDALSDCNLYSLNLAVGTMESDFKLTRDGLCVFFSLYSRFWFGLVWSMSWRWARASTTIRNFMSLTLSTIFPLSLLYAYTLHKHQMSHNSAIRMNTNNWQKKNIKFLNTKQIRGCTRLL